MIEYGGLHEIKYRAYSREEPVLGKGKHPCKRGLSGRKNPLHQLNRSKWRRQMNPIFPPWWMETHLRASWLFGRMRLWRICSSPQLMRRKPWLNSHVRSFVLLLCCLLGLPPRTRLGPVHSHRPLCRYGVDKAVPSRRRIPPEAHRSYAGRQFYRQHQS